MIRFDSERNVFILDNHSISYIIYKNSVGVLETLYFGETIDDIYDVASIAKAKIDNGSTQYFDRKEGVEKSYIDGFKSTCARLEVGTHGLFDKRGGPIIAVKCDGSYENEYRYISHEIIKGVVYPSKEQPSVFSSDDEAMTLVLHLKDTHYDIEVVEYISIYKDKDVICKSFAITNKTKEAIRLNRAYSMQLDLPEADYTMVHFKGRWSKERDYTETRLTDGIFEVSSNYGRSSHEENPFVYLKNNTNNEVIGFNLVYSGNFTFRVFIDYMGGTHVLYGINDEDFSWKLNCGDTFVTPQALISYSSTGVDSMSQSFHSLIKKNLITYKHEAEYKPVLFNSWEGCYFDFDTERILGFIEASKKIGAELFVLDDGWFSTRDSDYTGLGEWTVNDKKIDLDKVITKCHSLDMKFGIWFEPEMINPDIKLFKDHPEYVLGNKRDNIVINRHQFHLDFANQEVVDNIFAQMVKIIDKYAIDYIKWDYNRIVAEHMSSNFPADQQGEIYHRLVLGYYDLLRRLTMKYPNIMFEGCASGGGRFDLGTLAYCPQIWCSDESNPVQRMFIQYNTSIGYPLTTIGSHANDNKLTSYTTKACLALFGTYGYEMNPKLLTESEIAELSEVAKIYKKYHKRVIEEGTLYHLMSPSETNFMSMLSVSSTKDTALMILMNKLKEGDRYRFIKLKGLDTNSHYRNSFDGKTYSGDYYMKVGLNFSRLWFDEFSCHLVIIEKVD